ncbi:tetratricopeptide repeat protein [Neiella marina]|uniref:Tetratricopeptide repeat protein n=1 Tax=Neiella holothuriorum TaxID=2870530 RepID=A0ABS7EDM9_9GAMM|nr:tetratricopeptide repeat protein [Neiella holothuriorum]MBW8190435.1 tetratricopeptide repeat protein [Neiella holothuriorum]
MDFVWIRPEWLWVLIPWGILALITIPKQQRQSNLQQLVAPHLQTQVLELPKASKGPLPLTLFALLLAIIAGSGPSFSKQNAPLVTSEQARVLILDMSLSVWATDIKPNRLARLRYKAIDFVNATRGGETGLIAFAGDAFVISPMTGDGRTLSTLINSLSPDIMPAYGSRPDKAIAEAIRLMRQAGHPSGSIVMMTDGISERRAADITDLLQSTDYSLSLLQVGTPAGAPIQLPNGELLKNNRGEISIPTADPGIVKSLARQTGGVAVQLTDSNRDINYLADVTRNQASSDAERQELTAEIRADAGPFLMILIVPIMLLLFRQGALVALLLVVVLPSPSSHAMSWQDLWQTKPQQGQQAFDNGEHKVAAELFEQPMRKGSAYYRDGDYDNAVKQFEQLTDANGRYNLGNALAQQGKLDEAIEAYEQALAQQPDFAEAQYNKELLEQLKQQQEQQQDNQQNNSQQSQQDQSEQQNDEQQSQQDSNDSDSQSDQQQSEQSDDSNSDKNDDDSNENSDKDQQSDQAENESKNEQDSSSDQQDEAPQQNDADDSSTDENNAQNDSDNSDQQDSELQSDLANKPEQPEESDQGQQQQAAPSPQPTEPEQQQTPQPVAPQTASAAENDSEGAPAEPIKDVHLERLPDDPSVLLRNKMQLEYQKRQAAGTLVTEDEVW